MGSTVHPKALTHALARFKADIERMAWSTVRAVVGKEIDRRLAMRKPPRARPSGAARRSLQARSRKLSSRARASPPRIARSQPPTALPTGPDRDRQMDMTHVRRPVSAAHDQLGPPHGGDGPTRETTRRSDVTWDQPAAWFPADANNAAAAVIKPEGLAVIKPEGLADLVRPTPPSVRGGDDAALVPSGLATSISCPPVAELRLRLVPNVDPERFDGEALEQMQRDQWGEGSASRMTRLVLSFPTLADADGVEPWNPEALIAWACDRSLDEDCAHALRFALHLWLPTNDWRTEAASVLRRRGHSIEEAQSVASAFVKFDVISALGSWDHLHQAAFLAWIGVPFYP